MVKHFIGIGLVILIIAIFIFLPYFPGDYDEVVVTFSIMAQMLGMAGLLLVPIGIIWLLYEHIQKRKNVGSSEKVAHRFALVTAIIGCFVGLVVAIGAFINSTVLAIITLLLCFVLNRIWFRHMKATSGYNYIPLYLILIPIVVVGIRIAFIQQATTFSRDRAIQNTKQLIHDIEVYHDKNGHYPVSLLSLHEDYEPDVRGIKRYYYEPFGEAYNIYFEQFATALDIKEIVMYNKLDQHEFSSHNSDLLQLTLLQIEQQRGYVKKYDLLHEHWKYFWFD